MKIQSTVTDLTAEQWERINRVVQVEYDLTGIRATVCAVFEHAGLERHVEMPLGVFTGLLMSMQLSTLAVAIETAVSAVSVLRRDANE